MFSVLYKISVLLDSSMINIHKIAGRNSQIAAIFRHLLWKFVKLSKTERDIYIERETQKEREGETETEIETESEIERDKDRGMYILFI